MRKHLRSKGQIKCAIIIIEYLNKLVSLMVYPLVDCSFNTVYLFWIYLLVNISLMGKKNPPKKPNSSGDET